MTIRRPFGELDLGDQLGFEPHTVFHLFSGQGPLGALLFWQDYDEAASRSPSLLINILGKTKANAVAPQVSIVVFNTGT